MFSSQSSLQAFKVYFRQDLFHRTTEFRRLFCHSQISLICLIYLSFPSLYFYTIRSILMFLKVLNFVNFKCLHKPRLFLIIDLVLFAKLLDDKTKTIYILELLAINHSSSKRRIIFCSSVVEVLLCSGCFITCMGAHFPAVELDNAIWFSTLSRMSGFLWHSSK